MQGVQLLSFDVDPSILDELLAEGLWKPTPLGQVVLVMFWHSVGESGGYCPGGHMKTQQTPLMVVLPGWHGGEVLFVVVVVLPPRVVHVCILVSIGNVASTFKITCGPVGPTVCVVPVLAFKNTTAFVESAASYIFASSILP